MEWNFTSKFFDFDTLEKTVELISLMPNSESRCEQIISKLNRAKDK